MAMTANRIGQSGPGILDFGTAALAAVSAGFVAFAMPEGTFAAIVEATRLPDLIAAAQPPLGQTARLAAVAASALLTFLLVFSLMRALDRLPAGSTRTVIEKAPEAPRVRRADSHPDAPARRPLLARRDLGEPEEMDVLDTADFIKAPEASIPNEADDIVEGSEPGDTLEFVEAAEAAQAAEEAGADEVAEDMDESKAATDELREQDDVAAIAKPVIQPAREPFADFLDPVEPEEDPWFSEPLPTARTSPAPAVQELEEESPEAEPDRVDGKPNEAAVQARDEEDDSVGALMERLERGLDRRQKPQALAPEAAEPTTAPSPQAEQVGHRLRSAISELQKVASREN
jgi:hypothetical protein